LFALGTFWTAVRSREVNQKVEERTHPLNILEEWTHNPILEAGFVEFGPVDPHCLILWDVMDAIIEGLAGDAKESKVAQRTQ